jgi:hypothetical protein
MAFLLGLALFVGLAGALDAKLRWRRSSRESTTT